MKRLLALLLSMLMLFSAFSFTTIVNSVGYPENNTWDSSEWITDDMLVVMNKLGITSWNSVSAIGSRNEEVVTRWFMAYYVNKLVDLELKTPDKFETLFKDLTSEHKYYPYIKACVEAGYMQGYPDGYFRPDEPISTAEVEAVLLKVLGYEQYISAFGEARVRNITKITDGIPSSESIVQPQMLRMIYNALNSPVIRSEKFNQNKDGSMDVEYVLDDTYLGFEHFFDVKHEVAVLDGVKGTTLIEGTEKYDEGEISIAGIVYNCDQDVTDLLGYRVNYFYKEDSNDKYEIIHITKSDKNRELVLKHDVIDKYENGVYVYEDGNKTKEVSISSTTRVIYNDVANPLYDASEMVPKYGKVTFIDNDGKKGYEVLKIEDYDFYFVSSVNETENKIFDAESIVFDDEGNKIQRLPLNLNCDDLEILNGDSEINIGRVRKSNLLAVKRSSSNSNFDKLKIELFKVAAKGVKITSVREDYITTENSKYPIWDGVKNVEMGKNYNLYTFEDVVVFALEDKTAGAEYAYLLNMGIDGNQLNRTTKFAVMDMDGNYNAYEGAEKIKIDGNQLSDPYKMADALIDSAQNYSNGYSEDYPMSQPVKISFNSKGQINYVDTFQYNAGAEDEGTLRFVPEAKGTTNYYNYYNKTIYNLAEGTTNQYTKHVASIETATTILFVPGDRFDEASYMNRGLTNGDTYTIDVVDRDEKIYVPEAVFVYYNPQTSGISKSTRTFIISELYSELGSDGEQQFFVTGYNYRTKYTYTCNEDVYRKLSIGDVYMFEVDRNKKIIADELVYSIDDEFPERISRQDVDSKTVPPASSRGTVYGSLIHYAGSYARVSQSLPDDVEGYEPDFKVENFYIADAGIYKYSVVRGQPMVEVTSMGSETTYYIDPEKPAILLLNVNNGVNQVYIIEK